MKLITHPKAPKPVEMLLRTNPMTVWLSKTQQLLIYRGDSIRRVAKAMRSVWTHLSKRECRELAGFWFAIGEASASRTFATLDYDASSDRVYSPRARKTRALRLG